MRICVFLAQEIFIGKCILAGWICVTATQMLVSAAREGVYADAISLIVFDMIS